MTTTRLPLAIITALLAATQLGADECGGAPEIDDPGFELWCETGLCSWRVERGQAERVPTWHRGDDGVELIGDDAAIAQISRATRGACLAVTMLADVDQSTEVMLELDVDSDGTVEHEERIAGAGFRPVEFLLLVGEPLRSVTFRIAKRGPGRAVLANIGAAATPQICPGAPITSMPPEHATVDGSGGAP
jgi:hypothetical protein